LRKGHGQILVAARKTTMVRISAIALDALLELVRGQVIHELGEYGLSGIYPSLPAIGVVDSHSPIAAGSVDIDFKSKNESYKLSLLICDGYSK
jgi:hypothetical protein